MTKDTFISAVLVGLIASIAFILIQPLFGMATLTSRHAAAYVNLGAFSETAALSLAWFVHISVSILYALISAIIFKLNHSLLVGVGQIIGLGWLTTLIATPANEWVIKFVTTGQFHAFSTLSALNTQVGPKLWLHIVFFALVVGGLYLAKIARAPNHSV